jgi:hypothetical protein
LEENFTLILPFLKPAFSRIWPLIFFEPVNPVLNAQTTLKMRQSLLFAKARERFSGRENFSFRAALLENQLKLFLLSSCKFLFSHTILQGVKQS